MRILIFSAYDPIPADETAMTRYAWLAEKLAERGAFIEYITSSFYHTKKQQRNFFTWYPGRNHENIKVVLLKVNRYRRNVGPRRTVNHWMLSRKLKRHLELMQIRPDAMIIASPPLQTANILLKWARGKGILSILDIQDQWPEAWEQFIPDFLPKNRILRRWKILAEKNQNLASAITAVTLDYLPKETKKPKAVFHLGIDTSLFGLPVPNNAGQISLVHVGSPQTHSPLPEIIKIVGTHGNMRFTIAGLGDESISYQTLINKKGYKNIHIIPWIKQEKLADELQNYSTGIAILNNASKALFPNRLFLYFAAGVPVVTNISGGEAAKLIEQNDAGVVINQLTPELLMDAVRIAADTPVEKRIEIQEWAKKIFDAHTIYAAYADWVMGMLKTEKK
jgi:glycosyltransferase involved in cell wall biosynthesis